MHSMESDWKEIKNPGAAGTAPEVILNHSQKEDNTNFSELHASRTKGEEEPTLSSSPIQDSAKNYIQQGWRPLPVPYQEKGPRLKGWQNLHLEIDDLQKYFKDEPQNIGVLLGEPSRGLVDIDLDAIEAIKLADEFLPETGLVFGRASKPRSHRLYVTNPIPATRQFATNEGLMLVELRSTGAQTIFPPSVHACGERIEFAEKGTCMSVSAKELEEKVARLAAAALLSRHWPQAGSRQHVAMALAGGLTRAGWEQKDIHHFIHVVAQAAGDEEASQRANCSDRTAKRTMVDAPVTGWTRLRDLIGGHVVDRLRNWLMPQGTSKDQIQQIRSGKGKEAEKHRKISTIVFQELSDCGVFYKTSNELYYFDQLDCRLFPLTDAEFRARINDRFDINGTEPTWKFVLEDLQKEALLHGQETTIHRFACYEKSILYVYKGKENVFRITSDSWSVVPNGTEGILFLNPEMEPVELSGETDPGALEKVLGIPNFDGSGNLTSEQEAKLYRLWVFSVFFESLLPTKPILLLLGVKGSGKTMGLKALLRALFGKKAQVLTLSKEKEDAFLAAVTSNHLVTFDNLDGEIKWLPNHLATAATGGDVPLRKLYTTNELVRYPVRCFLALTSREPDSLTRDDVVDRLLTLRVDRIHPFKPESQFLSEIDAARPQFWSELLKNLQAIVSKLPTSVSHPSAHRLADFASLAMNIGPVLGIPREEVNQLLEGMDSEKADFALEHNPLYQALMLWLEQKGMGEREWIDSKALFDEMQGACLGSGFSYKNAGVLSRALKNLKTELAGWIQVIGPEKQAGGNNKTFWKIRAGAKLVLTPNEQDVE